MTKIVQKEEKVLREVAKAVPLAEITSKKFQNIIKEMKQALATEEDGVAIAAPQIGESWRIFVISRNLPLFLESEKAEEKRSKEILPLPDDLVFINPEIKKRSKKTTKVPEGCLSVRWWYGDVKRSAKVTVRAYNNEGACFTMGATGLLAQAFQHEIDHLDGILFIDKAEDLKEYKPEK
jgi:peptide deformylase